MRTWTPDDEMLNLQIRYRHACLPLDRLSPSERTDEFAPIAHPTSICDARREVTVSRRVALRQRLALLAGAVLAGLGYAGIVLAAYWLVTLP